MSKKTAQLIDGDKISQELLLELKNKISQSKHHPGLAVILIGDDPASRRYVEKKKLACQKVGINFHGYFCGGEFYPNITEAEILEMIDWLNKDPEIDAIIIQVPIPKKFNTQTIINRISPQKDVDGFHPKNLDQAAVNSPLIKAIDLVLRETKESLQNKQAVVLAKNPIFSQPLKKNLSALGLKTRIVTPDANLSQETVQADILISIVGQPGLINKSMVKPGAIVIDLGTTLVGKNTWKGDVAKDVVEVASWLTPVPGGVGPLTVAMLLENTYQLSL
ncbi:MAG: bifunctional 5,10-methylenetetrahydrofolate dehydrogenase/5,10-methenyltetrahydrofolate cyclohydrolase [Candidatus Buchananbacteria bacterium]|nr:bifunctional 5,10-methylenetetrahydrofolate dehydrogenase/5,10-methenyltetrahydrofolate cyclohydrolase [Candidatus Buchananbacteria bacterium]